VSPGVQLVFLNGCILDAQILVQRHDERKAVIEIVTMKIFLGFIAAHLPRGLNAVSHGVTTVFF